MIGMQNYRNAVILGDGTHVHGQGDGSNGTGIGKLESLTSYKGSTSIGNLNDNGRLGLTGRFKDRVGSRRTVDKRREEQKKNDKDKKTQKKKACQYESHDRRECGTVASPKAVALERLLVGLLLGRRQSSLPSSDVPRTVDGRNGITIGTGVIKESQNIISSDDSRGYKVGKRGHGQYKDARS